MARLTDAIEQLEYDLDRYPGGDAESLLNRRLLLRKAMEAWGRDQYGEGHRDGMRDVHHTTHRASQLEREAAKAAGKGNPDD